MPLSFTQIKETCIYIKDIELTKQFYHLKLGLPIIGISEGRHIFFRAGKSVLLCFIAEATRHDDFLPPHFGEGELHFAFETGIDEYENWKEEVKRLDIEIEKEVTWGKGLKSFYFRDPDNHVVEIVMPGIWDGE